MNRVWEQRMGRGIGMRNWNEELEWGIQIGNGNRKWEQEITCTEVRSISKLESAENGLFYTFIYDLFYIFYPQFMLISDELIVSHCIGAYRY